jgi:hypothetical protein
VFTARYELRHILFRHFSVSEFTHGTANLVACTEGRTKAEDISEYGAKRNIGA